MIFWVVYLLMLAGAILCVLLPLARRSGETGNSIDAMDVYKQQLMELDSSESNNTDEAAAIELERAEISRRILRHARKGGRNSDTATLAGNADVTASLTILILLPAIAISTYFFIGSPQLSDQPLRSQEKVALEGRSINEMVQIAERHLAQNPNDVKGWTVLADVYGRTNRPSDKARALDQVIKLSGETPALLTDLGEALTVANGNIVSESARKLFEKALVQKPDHIKARFYMATTLQQEGSDAEALKAWQALSLTRRNDTRWQQIVDRNIVELRKKLGKPALPGPTQEDVKNASQLSSTDRQVMIETMVANLADKLEDNPLDIDGWGRLIRSYSVLKKQDEALEALQSARSVFKNEDAALQTLDALASSLGLQSDNLKGESK